MPRQPILEDRILAVLRSSPEPLKAREIANEVCRDGGGPVGRRDVNSALYRRPLRDVVCQDDQFRWQIRAEMHSPVVDQKPAPAASRAKHGGNGRQSGAGSNGGGSTGAALPVPSDTTPHDDVRDFFLNLDRLTLSLVFDEYRGVYGREKYRYAKAVYQEWKSGRVRMSGEISHRLLAIVPQFLSFDVRYELMKKLWWKAVPRRIHLTVSRSQGLEAILEQVIGTVNRSQPDDVPEELKAEFQWLTGDDARMARPLIKRVADEITRHRLQALGEEIRRVFQASATTAGKVRSQHEITVPGVILTLVLHCGPVTAQGVSMASADGRPNDLVPTNRPEQPEQLPIRTSKDLLEQAVKYISPEKQQELIEKAAEEALKLQVEEARSNVHRQRSEQMLDDANEVIRGMAANPAARVRYQDELKGTDRRTEITVESPQTKRQASCFVATACFGDPQHSTVLVLRQFRDDVLRRFRVGRSFVAWYYRNGPVAAEWLDRHPGLKPPLRCVLTVVARVCRYGGPSGRV